MKNAIEEKKRGMTPEETTFIERFVADYCRPHAVVEAERLTAFAAALQMSFMVRNEGGFALAAGPSAPLQPEIRAPEEVVTFTFASEGAPDAPQAWRASLTVPPQAGPETMLTLAVSHAAGEPYEAGVFTLSGVALPLTAGRAEIPLGLFLAGIKDTNVSFREPNGEAVKGTLAFFC